MCQHCDNTLTRRSFLAALGAAGLSALAACQTNPQDSAVAPDLPGPDFGEAPHGPVPYPIDESKIIVPPTPATQHWIPSEIGPILPRAAWTNASPNLKTVEPMDGVKLITIHHSGDGKPFLGLSIQDTARHLEGVRQFHRQRGFNDIGYHFAIDRAGRVWQLRSLNYRGQHVRIGKNHTVWNEHNMGIVVLGDFNIQQLTAAQKDKLLAFIPYARKKYALSPSAVHLHGELVDTDCPGKFLRPSILQARQQNKL